MMIFDILEASGNVVMICTVGDKNLVSSSTEILCTTNYLKIQRNLFFLVARGGFAMWTMTVLDGGSVSERGARTREINIY